MCNYVCPECPFRKNNWLQSKGLSGGSWNDVIDDLRRDSKSFPNCHMTNPTRDDGRLDKDEACLGSQIFAHKINRKNPLPDCTQKMYDDVCDGAEQLLDKLGSTMSDWFEKHNLQHFVPRKIRELRAKKIAEIEKQNPGCKATFTENYSLAKPKRK